MGRRRYQQDDEPEEHKPAPVPDRFWGRYGDGRRIAASVAPPEIHTLYNSRAWTDENMGELAVEAIKAQLAAYSAAQMTSEDALTGPSDLSKETISKILALTGENPQEDAEAIAKLADSPAVWNWEKVPYATHLAGLAKSSIKEEDKADLDEWILANEKWLRHNRDLVGDWKRGLIGLSQVDAAFPGSSLTDKARAITRPSLPGFTFLDDKRAPVIHIQPSVAAFQSTFADLTNNQLKGLDWANIFIAGGIVLGTLLSTPGSESLKSGTSASQWKSSDIDFYIYGLDPLKANEKIRHLFEIFKANLPQDAPTLVVRNSKTISFLSYYPLRRFQVVLKLVKDPKEVLLNFDLDICAIGYDGNEVWMLPRAARALETGYNVFTMDMVEGHYLGDRRASQEQRVFKYANKGYGIRILPSYIEAVGLDVLQGKQDRGRRWFERLYRKYMSWSDNGRDLKPSYQEGNHDIVPLRQRRPEITLPIFTHALMDTRDQKSTSPGNRSCLVGFELLYRHVALWEAEQNERIVIQDDVWASTTYENSYDDLPQYPWDPSFVIADFQSKIAAFNDSEYEKFLSSFPSESEKSITKMLVNDDKLQRMVYGETIDDVFAKSSEIFLPLFLPAEVMTFCNDLVETALKDRGLPVESLLSIATKPDAQFEESDKGMAVYWHVSTVLMWQQIDRRIDEVHEVLWSFHRANAKLENEEGQRVRAFQTQLSQRAIRKSPQKELDEFKRWARRGPGPIAGTNYGAMGQGFWDNDPSDGGESDETDDDEDREDPESNRSYDGASEGEFNNEGEEEEED